MYVCVRVCMCVARCLQGWTVAGKGEREGKEGKEKVKGREGKGKGGESVPLALILQFDHW